MTYPIPTKEDKGQYFWYKEHYPRSVKTAEAEVVRIKTSWIIASDEKVKYCNAENANAYEVVFSYRGGLSYFVVMLDGTVVKQFRNMVGDIEQIWGPKVIMPDDL